MTCNLYNCLYNFLYKKLYKIFLAIALCQIIFFCFIPDLFIQTKSKKSVTVFKRKLQIILPKEKNKLI